MRRQASTSLWFVHMRRQLGEVGRRGGIYMDDS